jgi:uncharacterized membrane protein
VTLVASRAHRLRQSRPREHALLPVGTAVAWTLVSLVAAASLELAFYGHGGRQALGDVPGRYIAWHLGANAFPYHGPGIEYPVVIGYLSYLVAAVGGTATRFFLGNAALDVVLALAMTMLLRPRAGGRLWRWIAAPPLILYAFHNWDLLAMVPAIVGLYAYSARSDRTAGTALAVGASTKVFPGLFVPPLAIARWCGGDRRGAARLVDWALATTAVLNAPIAFRDGSAWWYQARFQGTRRFSWGTAWFWLLRVPGAHTMVRTDTAHVANLLAGGTLLTLLAVITVASVRHRLDAIAIGAAVTAAFLLSNKIYSPNYDLWVVPFFVLLPIARRVWVAFCIGDVGIFVLVYGHFHALVSAHAVHLALPLFVMLRASALVFTIVSALTMGREDSESRQSASAPASPVRMRVTDSTGRTQIFPSPILPVRADSAIASFTDSASSSATSTSMRTLGTKSTVYSAPRYTSVCPR